MDRIIQHRCGKTGLLQADDHRHEVPADLLVGRKRSTERRRTWRPGSRMIGRVSNCREDLRPPPEEARDSLGPKIPAEPWLDEPRFAKRPLNCAATSPGASPGCAWAFVTRDSIAPSPQSPMISAGLPLLCRLAHHARSRSNLSADQVLVNQAGAPGSLARTSPGIVRKGAPGSWMRSFARVSSKPSPFSRPFATDPTSSIRGRRRACRYAQHRHGAKLPLQRLCLP